ncbi:MAG: terminase, partial [Cystobacter sp.]
MTSSRRPEGLLAWQWHHYGDNHAQRRNLALHALTNPLFLAGSLAVLVAPFVSLWLLLGLVPAALAIAIQGAGHRKEAVAPVPFEGPLDVVKRILV